MIYIAHKGEDMESLEGELLFIRLRICGAQEKGRESLHTEGPNSNPAMSKQGGKYGQSTASLNPFLPP